MHENASEPLPSDHIALHVDESILVPYTLMATAGDETLTQELCLPLYGVGDPSPPPHEAPQYILTMDEEENEEKRKKKKKREEGDAAIIPDVVESLGCIAAIAAEVIGVIVNHPLLS
jgi:hypothetical protein